MALTNKIQTINGVVVGSYLQVIQVACVDADGVAQDVSGYTTRTAVAMPPDHRKTVTASVTYVTDGTDGLVQWSFASGDIDRAGNWEVQLEFSTVSKMVKSYTAIMEVGRGER